MCASRLNYTLILYLMCLGCYVKYERVDECVQTNLTHSLENLKKKVFFFLGRFATMMCDDGVHRTPPIGNRLVYRCEASMEAAGARDKRASRRLSVSVVWESRLVRRLMRAFPYMGFHATKSDEIKACAAGLARFGHHQHRSAPVYCRFAVTVPCLPPHKQDPSLTPCFT